jgi:hypothetical protein
MATPAVTPEPPIEFPPLRLVSLNAETGEVLGELKVGEWERLQGEVRTLEETRTNLATILNEKQREIERLKRDVVKRRREHSQRLVIQSVYDEWHRVLGKGSGCRLGPARFDAVAARLAEDRPRWHFSLAIAGAKADAPVTVGKGGRRVVHDDLELICRDEVHFERFCKRCPVGVAREIRAAAVPELEGVVEIGRGRRMVAESRGAQGSLSTETARCVS